MSVSTEVAGRDLTRPFPVSAGAPYGSMRLGVTRPAPALAPAPTGSERAMLDPALPPRRLRPETGGSRPSAGGIDTVATLPWGEQVAITVRSGEAVGLVGPAGSGKTLLAQWASGLFRVGGPGDRPAPGVALVAEDVTVHEDLTVGATATYWAAVMRAVRPVSSSAAERRVADVVAAVGLGRWLATPIVDCHQIVRCALAIAVTLLDRPTVLILDDPLRKVAARHRPAVLGLLGALRDLGIGLLYATRHETEAAALCSRILQLPAQAVDVAACHAG